jgi:hypothetical protein
MPDVSSASLIEDETNVQSPPPPSPEMHNVTSASLLEDETTKRADATYIINHVHDVNAPEQIDESSVDQLPSFISAPADTFELTFQMVQDGTKRARAKLIDSHGYTYNVQRRRNHNNTTDWQCTIRPKENPCRASVIQRGDNFKVGKNEHNHSAQPGAAVVTKITATMKSKAAENMFKSAQSIVTEVLLETIGSAPCPSLPKTASLTLFNSPPEEQAKRPNKPGLRTRVRTHPGWIPQS